MNCFIETFLELLIETLIQMDTELKEKSQLLNIAFKKLEKEPLLNNMSKNHIDIMFVLAQNHFFDSGSGLTIRDLADILTKSEATIRKVIRELLQLSLIEQKGERPAYYCIVQKYFEG